MQQNHAFPVEKYKKKWHNWRKVEWETTRANKKWQALYLNHCQRKGFLKKISLSEMYDGKLSWRVAPYWKQWNDGKLLQRPLYDWRNAVQGHDLTWGWNAFEWFCIKLKTHRYTWICPFYFSFLKKGDKVPSLTSQLLEPICVAVKEPDESCHTLLRDSRLLFLDRDILCHSISCLEKTDLVCSIMMNYNLIYKAISQFIM